MKEYWFTFRSNSSNAQCYIDDNKQSAIKQWENVNKIRFSGYVKILPKIPALFMQEKTNNPLINKIAYCSSGF